MKRATVIVLVVALFALFAMFALSGVPAQARYRFPQPVGETQGGEPPPIAPEPVATATPDGFQLIGFSTKLLDGNHGVLNMTRACAGSFQGSRICTADEINRTVNVPEPPHVGHAWIRLGRTSNQAASDDCAGWRSNSPKDRAMTIELDTESGCYGGYVTRNCNELLPVACCAPMIKEP